MSRRLPVILAGKMDAYLERKNARIRRDSIYSAFMGFVTLFSGIYFLITEKPMSWARSLVFVVIGCIALLWSLWDHMVYKRSLSSDVKVLQAAPTTNGLPPHDAEQMVGPPASISESTTQRLGAPVERKEKS